MRLMTILATTFFALLASNSYANSWSTYQGDNGHTGYADVIVNPTNLRVLWTAKLSDEADWYTGIDQPVVNAHGIYAIVSHGRKKNGYTQLIALDIENGSTRWVADMNGYYSSPAVANGKIYLLEEFEKATNFRLRKVRLRAIDELSGKMQFSSTILMNEGSWNRQTPVVDSNQVYIGGRYNQFALNADTGVQNWKSGEVESDNLIATISQKYVMRIMYNALALLDRTTGLLVTTISAVDGAVWDYPRSDSLIVYDDKSQTAYSSFTNFSGACANGGCPQLVAFDIANKYVKWRIPLRTSISDLAFGGDNVFYISQTDGLVAINAVTGNFDWRWKFPSYSTGRYIVTKNAVILPSYNVIYLVSRETHKIMGMIPARGYSTIAVVDNVLYIASAYYDLNKNPVGNIATITAIQLN